MAYSQTSSLVIDSHDVEYLLNLHGHHRIMDELILELEESFRSFDYDGDSVPPRSGFNYQSPSLGLVEWMPAFDKDQHLMVNKMVGYHPYNPKDYQLPTILSSISIYDCKTGHLLAICDGVLLTALRTGAASAVASKYLAHPDSKVLGIIGCGAQSVTQVHALSRAFELDTILFFDTDNVAMQSFPERIASCLTKVEVIPLDINGIVTNSDILSTATSISVGEGPLFSGDLVTKDHLHINAVGSDFPGKIELPLDLLKQCYVSPDFLLQARNEGECQQLDSVDIGDELGHLISMNNLCDSLRDQRTVFDSTGFALEDLVAAHFFLDLARSNNCGKYIELEMSSGDVKNPYHFLTEHTSSDLKPVYAERK